jgi:hypothetical protein
MTAPIPKHESAIDFDINKVKEAILKFNEVNKDSDFLLKEKNDIFGSYVFSIFKHNSWNGFSSGSLHVTLNSIDENKTRITVETLNNGKAEYVNIRDLTDTQNHFLNALANILTGNLESSSIQVPKGNGCLGFTLFWTLTACIAIVVLSV